MLYGHALGMTITILSLKGKISSHNVVVLLINLCLDFIYSADTSNKQLKIPARKKKHEAKNGFFDVS